MERFSALLLCAVTSEEKVNSKRLSDLDLDSALSRTQACTRTYVPLANSQHVCARQAAPRSSRESRLPHIYPSAGSMIQGQLRRALLFSTQAPLLEQGRCGELIGRGSAFALVPESTSLAGMRTTASVVHLGQTVRPKQHARSATRKRERGLRWSTPLSGFRERRQSAALRVQGLAETTRRRRHRRRRRQLSLTRWP